jgi:hypothetical protein
MEWVDGFRLTDRASLKEYGLDESKLVDTLVQCSLRQILGTLRSCLREWFAYLWSLPMLLS